MSPTVRKRTDSVLDRLARLGRRERRHRHQQAVAAHHLAPVREVEATAAASRSRSMYCQTSSSVQLRDREHAHVLARVDAGVVAGPSSSGRWFFGSHWPKLVAEREDALLGAGLLLVAARAADQRRRSRARSIASSSVTDWRRVARVELAAQAHACRGAIESSTERTISRSSSSAARRVAELEHLGKVVAGVDVQQREAEALRPERLLRQPQQDAAVLAAGEQQRRLGALRRDLAQDVDRLRLEPLEMIEAGGVRGSSSSRALIAPLPSRPRSSAGAARIPWPCRAPTTSGRRADPPRAAPRGCRARSRSTDSRGHAGR